MANQTDVQTLIQGLAPSGNNGNPNTAYNNSPGIPMADAQGNWFLQNLPSAASINLGMMQGQGGGVIGGGLPGFVLPSTPINTAPWVTGPPAATVTPPVVATPVAPPAVTPGPTAPPQLLPSNSTSGNINNTTTGYNWNTFGVSGFGDNYGGSGGSGSSNQFADWGAGGGSGSLSGLLSGLSPSMKTALGFDTDGTYDWQQGLDAAGNFLGIQGNQWMNETNKVDMGQVLAGIGGALGGPGLYALLNKIDNMYTSKAEKAEAVAKAAGQLQAAQAAAAPTTAQGSGLFGSLAMGNTEGWGMGQMNPVTGQLSLGLLGDSSWLQAPTAQSNGAFGSPAALAAAFGPGYASGSGGNPYVSAGTIAGAGVITGDAARGMFEGMKGTTRSTGTRQAGGDIRGNRYEN